jgi:hypothetical protein
MKTIRSLILSTRFLASLCAVACLVQGILNPELAAGCLLVGVFMVVFSVALD